MNRIILVAAFLYLTINLNAQSNSNSESYLIVPMRFEFSAENDQYRVNTLTRHLFKSSGFQVYFDTQELPESVFENRCRALYADVLNSSGVFKTKLLLQVKDCRDNVIASSSIGTSKDKDFKKAYHEALNEAFKSLDIESILAAYDTEDVEPKTSPITETSIALAATTESATQKAVTIEETKQVPQLFAQPLDGGAYQLINMEPKVVMVIEASEVPNSFKVRGEEAILFKRGEVWVYAKKGGDQVVEKEYKVKF